MNKILLIAFNLVALHVSAQKEVWFSGAVVTSTSEVLTGQILFDPRFDLVVIRDHDETKVFSPFKLSSFRYHDYEANINRSFISIDDGQQGKIYEVVLSGAIPVLRKAKALGGFHPSDADGYNYYFVQNGLIKNLKKFRSSLYPHVKKLLITEERRRHLNPSLMADAIKLIDIYNRQSASLFASK